MSDCGPPGNNRQTAQKSEVNGLSAINIRYITAMLTAFGLIISTIITLLTDGAAGAGGSPPKHPNKLKEWFKNKLKALARLLGRIAGKAAAALPGIIGSIIAGVLNFFKI